MREVKLHGRFGRGPEQNRWCAQRHLSYIFCRSEWVRLVFRLTLHENGARALRVLCLGAHSDDIEIGCGGTILRLIETCRRLEIYWVVFSAEKSRRKEALDSARRLLRRVKKKTIVIKGYKGSFFPYVGGAIKRFFEQIKSTYSPDVVLTHYRNDLHQDHRTISDLTWNTFRRHLILEYEIPKYDGDMGSPNFFVHLDRTICLAKTQHILESFRTQRGKHWFTEDVFLSMMRLRGVESNAPDRYAEGFYCRKFSF